MAESDPRNEGAAPQGRRPHREEINEDLIPEDQLPGADDKMRFEERSWTRVRREDTARLILTGLITGVFFTILFMVAISALRHDPVGRAMYTALTTSAAAEGWVLRYFFGSNRAGITKKRRGDKKAAQKRRKRPNIADGL